MIHLAIKLNQSITEKEDVYKSLKENHVNFFIVIQRRNRLTPYNCIVIQTYFAPFFKYKRLSGFSCTLEYYYVVFGEGRCLLDVLQNVVFYNAPSAPPPPLKPTHYTWHANGLRLCFCLPRSLWKTRMRYFTASAKSLNVLSNAFIVFYNPGLNNLP